MSNPLTSLSALALLVLAVPASVLQAQDQRQKASSGFKASESSAPFVAKPCFDYTRMQEPESVWFKRLEAPTYDLSNAILAAIGGRENVRATGARMVTQPRPHYQVELMAEGSSQFEMLHLEPETGKLLTGEFTGEPCFDHGAFSPEELNKLLFESSVPLAEAAVYSVNLFNHGAFSRQIKFVAQGEDRRHETEVFTVHKNGKNRRWHVVVSAKKLLPQPRMKIPLYQWPGEPIKPGEKIKELDSGLLIHDFIVGDGELIEPDSMIRAHYRLVLMDNQAIYNSKLGSKPVTFRVRDSQIEGLKRGLAGMRAGGKRKIIIPAELAFGSRGVGEIPPNAVVVADIGVLSVVDEGN